MFAQTIDPTREERTQVVLAALERRRKDPVSVLELGSGPGSLSRRILRDNPGARLVAVDTDPVLLRISELALHRYQGRSTWILADLRTDGWAAGLPLRKFDTVVTTMVLHWFYEREIRAIYRAVANLLRPGGRFINADFIPTVSPTKKAFQVAKPSVDRRARTRATPPPLREFKQRWARWWQTVEDDPELKEALQARRVRLPGAFPPTRTAGPARPVNLERHLRALRGAGFQTARVGWQDQGFRVLVATK